MQQCYFMNVDYFKALHLSTNHQLGSHFFRFLGVHRCCLQTVNIQRTPSSAHGWSKPCKMNIFCLIGHSHQKWPTNLCCMTERPRAFNFCFKASVCELLGDEYSISWLLSARMHLSGTAIHITISPLSHTQLTYCPLRLPAHPPPTHPVDGCNVTLKKLSSKNHTQAPGGLALPKTCQTTAKTLWKIGLQNQTVRRVYM